MEKELRELLGKVVWVHNRGFEYPGLLTEKDDQRYYVDICSFRADEVVMISRRDIYLED